MAISEEQIRHVADLARLSLEDREVDEMTRQLAQILAYVETLQQVDTDGVEPMSHVHAITATPRDDRPQPTLAAEAALAGAPDRKGDLFRVPKIID
jgi:aspartyl-tRNA(Asn)/glutamyl-tRNA(Gln) amidotransferase subunit C